MTPTARPTQQALAEAPSAGLLRRLGAMVYDALLVLALALTTTGALELFAERPEIPEGAETQSLEGMQVISGAPLTALLLAQTFAFFAFFWLRHGRTLGMQAWRLRIVAPDGSGPDLTQVIQRFIVAAPSLLLFGVGYLWRLLDPAGLTWPDRASGTRVVVVPHD